MTRSNSLFCSHVNGIPTTNTYNWIWCLIKQSVSVIPCTQCIICVWQLFAFFKSQFSIFIREKKNWLQSRLSRYMNVRFFPFCIFYVREWQCVYVVSIGHGIRVFYKMEYCAIVLHISVSLSTLPFLSVRTNKYTYRMCRAAERTSYFPFDSSFINLKAAYCNHLLNCWGALWCVVYCAFKMCYTRGSPSDFSPNRKRLTFNCTQKKPVFFQIIQKTHTQQTCNMQQRSTNNNEKKKHKKQPTQSKPTKNFSSK